MLQTKQSWSLCAESTRNHFNLTTHPLEDKVTLFAQDPAHDRVRETEAAGNLRNGHREKAGEQRCRQLGLPLWVVRSFARVYLHLAQFPTCCHRKQRLDSFSAGMGQPIRIKRLLACLRVAIQQPFSGAELCLGGIMPLPSTVQGLDVSDQPVKAHEMQVAVQLRCMTAEA